MGMILAYANDFHFNRFQSFKKPPTKGFRNRNHVLELKTRFKPLYLPIGLSGKIYGNGRKNLAGK